MRMLKGLGGVVLLMLLATGCFRVDAKIEVGDDGAGSINLLSALDTDAVTSALGDFGDLAGEGADAADLGLGSPQELCDSFSADFNDTSTLPEGAQVTPYDEDGFCGSRISVQLPPSTNHDAVVTDIFDSPSELHKEGENWVFSSTFDVGDITAETGDAPPFLVDALFGEASFTVSVKLPGRPIEGQNNATSVDGNTFSWDIDLFSPPDRLFAQTEPGSPSSGGSNGLLIGLVIAAILVAAALAWILLKKRSAKPDVPVGSERPPMAAASGAMGSPGPMQPHNAGGAPPAGDSRSTVIMNTAQTPQAQTAAAATAAQAPEVVWDAELGAWVTTDPDGSRRQHDPATNTWRRVE
jgi:hypothetical protein